MKNHSREILLITLVGVIGTLFLVSLVILEFPEYPLYGIEEIPFGKECFVGDNYRATTINCDISYEIKTGSLNRLFPFFGLNEVTLKPDKNIETFFDVKSKYQDIECKISKLGNTEVVCDLSKPISKDYVIDMTYKKPLTDECTRPEQRSFDPHGSVDCSPENECVLNIKISAPTKCGLRGYNIIGPEGSFAGNNLVFIEENGIPYFLIKAEDGDYTFPVNIDKNDWKIYTIHFPKS